MKQVAQEKVVVEQRSSEWHAMRAKRIGASDAPILCGLSPWKSSLQLWLEKTGAVRQPDGSDNFAIQRGIRLEPVVLAMANIHLDRDFEPATFVHPSIQYLMASLDGWDDDFNEAIEIKIGNKKDHDKLFAAAESTPSEIIVPEKYYAQLQQQMYVKDLEFMRYVSYHLPKGTPDDRGDLRIVKVYRDQRFLDGYLPLAEAFYHCLIENKPPEYFKLKP